MDELNEFYEIPSRAELKRTAKQFMRGKNPSPWLVVTVAVALQNLFTMLELRVLGFSEAMARLAPALRQFMETGDSAAYGRAAYSAAASIQTGFGGRLICILLALMSTMVTVGLILFYVETVRERKGSFGNLLDGLTKLPRVIGYNIMVVIFTMGWILVPYIAMFAMMLISIESPVAMSVSILAGMLVILAMMIFIQIRYSQGLYFLLTRPEVGIIDCITLSKRIMKKRKGEYFVLMLSFLGWSILLYLVNLVLSALGIVGLILSIPLTAFVTMYQGFTYFLYHEAIQGRTYDPSQPPPAPELSEGTGSADHNDLF